jgi:predicted RNA-binding Zn ribbon-like protein
MDFLNTHAMPGGVPTEWLKTGADLLNWLEQADLIDAETAARFRTDKVKGQLEVVAKGARALREWLRAFVRRHAGQPLTAAAEAELGPLNLLLAGDKSFARVSGGGESLALQRLRRWETPEELLQPIATAIADLVCHADFRLIRACEGHDCTLMFLDRTKAHARRWCSMALCGNRAKAAAHRARKRQ